MIRGSSFGFRQQIVAYSCGGLSRCIRSRGRRTLVTGIDGRVALVTGSSRNIG